MKTFLRWSGWMVAGSCLAGSAGMPAVAAARADSRPNIVFILADDLGWTDTGAYGSRYYETPNIDRLAERGARFTQFHMCQNCAPTRAALMSGQYGPRTGVYTVGGIDRFDWSMRPLRPVDNVTDLPLDRRIVAQTLKNAGYATAMFGKWHLGEKGDHHPSSRGFDEAIVTSGKHYNFNTLPRADVPDGAYLADWLTDRAVDFIRRKKDGPFFLYLPHFGVHSPYQAKPELVEKFKAKPEAGGHHDPVYAAMIYSVDESVGRVVAALEDLGLGENTVVIFSSDNGGVGGYDREGIANKRSVTDNAPLRSGKGSLYEGGTRVPFVVRWPSVIAPGTVIDSPSIHVDLYPTFIELAGADRPEHPLDGESLVALFRNPAAQLRRDAIHQHFPGYLGAGPNLWRTTPVGIVQRGEWKLMEFFEDGRLELYHLREDVGESRNLASERPEMVRELHSAMLEWRKTVQAPMPAANESGGRVEKKGKKASNSDGESAGGEKRMKRKQAE